MKSRRDLTPPLYLHEVLEEELRAWKDGSRPAPTAVESEGSLSDEEIRERLRAVNAKLHDAAPAAVCLSGGGIRSATFGLGVLQGLARQGLLQKFDYISTVSGGGYIGSWVTSWISRTQHEAESVFRKLATGDERHPAPDPLDPEEAEIRHLRVHSNYLTPKLGLLSADTWTLIATYLRNLFVNWLVLIPFILAILALPRIWAAVLYVSEPKWLIGAALILAFVCGVVLVTYLAFARPLPGISDRRSRRWLFAICGPLMLLMQAAALCFVRAQPSSNEPGLPRWWEPVWRLVRRLPGGRAVEQWVLTLPEDTALLVCLIITVVMLNVTGWTIYTVRLWRRRATTTPSAARSAAELFAAVVAGFAAGFCLWLIIVKIFDTDLPNRFSIPGTVGELGFERFLSFAPGLYLLVFFAQTMMFVGLAGRFNDDEDREWWGRWAGWLLIATVVWLALNALAIFGPFFVARIPEIVAALGGVTGLVTLILGRSGASPATQAQKAEKGWTAVAANLGLAAAAPIFVVIALSSLSFLNGWLIRKTAPIFFTPVQKQTGWIAPAAAEHFEVLRRTPIDIANIYTGALLFLAGFTSLFVHLNRFSMHGLYRNRLTRAYLGASNPNRKPNPFTGFDENDNVPMEKLPLRPFHVVNIALNLVSDNNLAWQQRKAASFTASPLHCGSAVLDRTRGYRRSGDYAMGISLGTAVAISGAAVSPNMGYHTSPAVSFLLALFNVRLGWWLGNSGLAGRHTYRRSAPFSSLWQMLVEAFGWTNARSPWIYVSDGGHFENLGLYEMVRRRCHTIVVSDAGRDPKISFEDLGNAIRKIRIDLGIPITIDDVRIYPREEKKVGRYFAIGTIEYPVVDGSKAKPGLLIYLKPSIYGQEPIDVRNYAVANVEFPHESTSDQWFTESQFESYRALGVHVIKDICGDSPAGTFEEFEKRLRTKMAT